MNNFKEEAYNLLEPYETWVKERIRNSKIIHSDETGMVIEGKRAWLHVASNDQYTVYYPHEKREKVAKENPVPPAPLQGEQKRGRAAQTKTRNLLDRMREHEDDILRFMTDVDVPFTNNQAERDIRMMKVQQKISGSFRSWDDARFFCRIRGYLSTCEKHHISSADALKILFNGKFPDFMSFLAE